MNPCRANRLHIAEPARCSGAPHRWFFAVFFFIFWACTTFWVLPAFSAGTVEQIFIRNTDNSTIFRLDLYGKDLTLFHDAGENEFLVSHRNFYAHEKTDIVRGMAYWVEVLKNTGTLPGPVIIRMGVEADTDYNAAAIFFADPATQKGLMLEALTGQSSVLFPSGVSNDPIPEGFHSIAVINDFKWDTQPNSNLPETAGTLGPTIIHEIGHALGIDEEFEAFESYLTGAEHFRLFTGPNAMRVYGGAVPMAHASNQEDSHFGLRNGLMTHCQITNYPMFMEAELAALVDIGYTIDLRNFFGTSLYGLTDANGAFLAGVDDSNSGKVIDNTTGFFQSMGLDTNGNWLGYANGTPNTSSFGVGLHFYGSYWEVTQRADLLADGPGGAGIRMDGLNNKVIIPAGLTVSGNGTQGTGLLVSFGENHVINSMGNIMATGSLGIAARFDFGAPYVGEKLESYGEYYINDPNEDWNNLMGQLHGPLVQEFNLSGALIGGPSSPNGQFLSGEWVDFAGRPLALYIGPGAHVAEINIMNGASIHGDIVSRWNPYLNSSIAQGTELAYMTDLTFGYMANSDGSATSTPDPDFRLNYDGNISGPDSLDIFHAGGTLHYSGQMRVHSYTMKDTSTSLLVGFDKGLPTTITAPDITLEAGTRIGFSPAPFTYGSPLPAGKAPALSLNATTLTNNATLLTPSASGVFAIGPWEYAYSGIEWNTTKSALLVNIGPAVFNHERGGTDAQTAPMALFMHSQPLRITDNRIIRRFTQLQTGSLFSESGSAASLLGKNQDSWQQFFANGAIPDLARQQKNLQTHSRNADQVQWLALDNAGWEARTGKSGTWVAPYYSNTSHRGKRHYNIEGTGVAFGIDHQFSEFFSLGAAVSLDYPRYHSSHTKVRAKSRAGIIYGGIVLPCRLELGFAGSLGAIDHEQDRKVLGQKYETDFTAQTFNAALSLGRQFAVSDSLVLRPALGWEHFYMTRPSHSEGAGPYALAYNSSRTRVNRLKAGFDTAWVFDRGDITARAYWLGIPDNANEKASAHFALDPARNAFQAPLEPLDKHSLELAASGNYQFGDATKIGLEYAIITGEKSTTHQGVLGVRFEF